MGWLEPLYVAISLGEGFTDRWVFELEICTDASSLPWQWGVVDVFHGRVDLAAIEIAIEDELTVQANGAACDIALYIRAIALPGVKEKGQAGMRYPGMHPDHRS